MNKNIITSLPRGGVYSTKFYKGGQAGLRTTCLPERLLRGGLRQSEVTHWLSGYGEVTL